MTRGSVDNIARLARNFSIWGSAIVRDLEVDEVTELVKRLDAPSDQLYVKNGVLRRDMSMQSHKVCAKKKETLLQEGHFACTFCGKSVFAHRSERDPVVI